MNHFGGKALISKLMISSGDLQFTRNYINSVLELTFDKFDMSEYIKQVKLRASAH